MKSVANRWLPGNAVTRCTRQPSGSSSVLASSFAESTAFVEGARAGVDLGDVCPAPGAERIISRQKRILLGPLGSMCPIAISTFEKLATLDFSRAHPEPPVRADFTKSDLQHGDPRR